MAERGELRIQWLTPHDGFGAEVRGVGGVFAVSTAEAVAS